MGTKLHCKTFFPGYYSMRDLNEDASTGSWSSFYEDKMLRNGQYYNGFIPTCVDGYSEYDKEVLKQTMLKHEAIFRNQVHELHRLYRIQRDLMDEIQKKGPYKYPMPMESSPFNPFSSQVVTGDSQKMWQMPTVPMLNSTFSRPSFPGTEDRQSPLNFLKESTVQSNSSPIKSGVSVNDYELDSNPKKFQKRMLDLQLPADVYIENEDREEIEKGKIHEVALGPLYCSNRNSGVETRSDVNVTLGTREKPNHGDVKKLDLHSWNSQHIHCLADLNEPIQGTCSEEAEPSNPINRLGPVACPNRIKGQQLPKKQNLNILGLSKDLFQDTQSSRDNRSIPLESEEYKPKWLAYNLEAGQSRISPSTLTSTYHHEKLPMSSERFQVDPKKPHELPQFLPSVRGKKETWFGGKLSSADTSIRNPDLTVPHLPENVAPPIASLLPAVSCTDDPHTASPVVSSQRKPLDGVNHSAAADKAFVSLNGILNGIFTSNRQRNGSISYMQSPSKAKEKLDLNVSLRSNPSYASEVPLPNGFNHGFQSESSASHLQLPLTSIDKLNLNSVDYSSYEYIDVHGSGKISKGINCTDVKSAKDMNLNVCLPNGSRDGINSEQDIVLIDGEEKSEDPSGGISWLRTKPASSESMSSRGGLSKMNLSFLQGCSQPLPSQHAESQSFQDKIGMEKGAPGFNKDSSTSQIEDNATHRIMLAGGPSSKIFGFSVPHIPSILKDQCPFSSSLMSCQDLSGNAHTKNGMTAASLNVDISCNSTLPNLEKQNQVSGNENGRNPTGSRNQINLNSVVPERKEQPPRLEISFINDGEVPISSSPGACAQFAAEIDLEVPVTSSYAMEDIPPKSETLGTNQPLKPELPMQSEADLQKTLARRAAEAIVDLSLGVCSPLEDSSSHRSSAALKDSLMWFSEVVSLNADHLESALVESNGRLDADNELSDDGVDFFEVMTLKLTETKVEEYFCKPQDCENQKEEETSPLPLVSRTRKTQRRRGRQRRDFQKDILPGLVSLSRQEVTEDLQIIGGLMRASGCSWQTGIAKRNGARNGWHCQARGRRRPRTSPASRAGNWVGLLPMQSSHGEAELEESISLQGWGKTTRRCRRQRFPTGNASTALT